MLRGREKVPEGSACVCGIHSVYCAMYYVYLYGSVCMVVCQVVYGSVSGSMCMVLCQVVGYARGMLFYLPTKYLQPHHVLPTNQVPVFPAIPLHAQHPPPETPQYTDPACSSTPAHSPACAACPTPATGARLAPVHGPIDHTATCRGPQRWWGPLTRGALLAQQSQRPPTVGQAHEGARV